MKKPWHIWILYSLSLLVVVPAMVWLSLQALELDEARENDRVQTELARREAELQERISSALWRMDGFLTNLVAKEATRPWYLYESFYEVASIGKPASDEQTGRGTKQTVDGRIRQASPLLFQPSQFVVLHFQIDPDGRVTSPQSPLGNDRFQAFSCGLTESAVAGNDARIVEVSELCQYETMLIKCSDLMLPDASPPEFNLANSANDAGNDAQTQENQQAFWNNEPGSSAQTETPFVAQLQSPLPQQSRSQQLGIKGSEKQQVQQTRNLMRGVDEYTKRLQSANNVAMTEWVANNRFEPQMAGAISTSRFVREGVMQPLWIDNRLILARRVKKESEEIIQCCWLDWEKIKQALTEEARDILPQVGFQAIEDTADIRWGETLATLPVQLVLNREEMIDKLDLGKPADGNNIERSGIRMSLIIAWCGLGFAAVASAMLLQGVLRLSERRGAFVSAVSHELRTPLTTFRMYAEMLAGKMVPPERQQQYVQTLKVEAERLSQLVENVLQFARLERSNQSSRLESVTLAELLDRFSDRLHERAERASMKLIIDIPDRVGKHSFRSDPVAIEQILFNLVDNACKYARHADRKQIELTSAIVGTRMKIVVQDFGPGVSKHERQRMFLPFRKSDQEAANTAQGVGLGLALCRRMAKSLGGRLDLADSSVGARMVLSIPVQSPVE